MGTIYNFYPSAFIIHGIKALHALLFLDEIDKFIEEGA
jgi:hypothetical protein